VVAVAAAARHMEAVADDHEVAVVAIRIVVDDAVVAAAAASVGEMAAHRNGMAEVAECCHESIAEGAAEVAVEEVELHRGLLALPCHCVKEGDH